MRARQPRTRRATEQADVTRSGSWSRPGRSGGPGAGTAAIKSLRYEPLEPSPFGLSGFSTSDGEGTEPSSRPGIPANEFGQGEGGERFVANTSTDCFKAPAEGVTLGRVPHPQEHHLIGVPRGRGLDGAGRTRREPGKARRPPRQPPVATTTPGQGDRFASTPRKVPRPGSRASPGLPTPRPW